jgi:hypothetical protein
MADTFTNWTGRAAIDARVAERRRQPERWNETIVLGDYHLPFSKAVARAEFSRWLWHP